MVANDNYISFVANPSPKAATRAQSESLLRSKMSFILTVALTSFIKGYSPKYHQSIENKGTYFAKLFHKIVCNARGSRDIYPVLP